MTPSTRWPSRKCAPRKEREVEDVGDDPTDVGRNPPVSERLRCSHTVGRRLRCRSWFVLARLLAEVALAKHRRLFTQQRSRKWPFSWTTLCVRLGLDSMTPGGCFLARNISQCAQHCISIHVHLHERDTCTYVIYTRVNTYTHKHKQTCT